MELLDDHFTVRRLVKSQNLKENTLHNTGNNFILAQEQLFEILDPYPSRSHLDSVQTEL